MNTNAVVEAMRNGAATAVAVSEATGLTVAEAARVLAALESEGRVVVTGQSGAGPAYELFE